MEKVKKNFEVKISIVIVFIVGLLTLTFIRTERTLANLCSTYVEDKQSYIRVFSLISATLLAFELLLVCIVVVNICRRCQLNRVDHDATYGYSDEDDDQAYMKAQPQLLADLQAEEPTVSTVDYATYKHRPGGEAELCAVCMQ